MGNGIQAVTTDVAGGSCAVLEVLVEAPRERGMNRMTYRKTFGVILYRGVV